MVFLSLLVVLLADLLWLFGFSRDNNVSQDARALFLLTGLYLAATSVAGCRWYFGKNSKAGRIYAILTMGIAIVALGRTTFLGLQTSSSYWGSISRTFTSIEIILLLIVAVACGVGGLVVRAQLNARSANGGRGPGASSVYRGEGE